MAKQENIKKVEEVLKKNPEGLMVNEIAEKAELTRQTVATILAEFRGAGSIKERQLGQAVLVSWKVGE